MVPVICLSPSSRTVWVYHTEIDKHIQGSFNRIPRNDSRNVRGNGHLTSFFSSQREYAEEGDRLIYQ